MDKKTHSKILKVPVYGLDDDHQQVIEAFVAWDGRRISLTGPTGLQWLRTREVWVGNELIKPDQGERFIRALFRAYSGTFLRIGRVDDH